MKLIASKDFYNNFEGRIGIRSTVSINSEELKHPKLIHKGFRFEIGSSPKFKGLGLEERQLVSKLATAGCIEDASDTEAVKRIEEEIKRAETEAAESETAQSRKRKP